MRGRRQEELHPKCFTLRRKKVKTQKGLSRAEGQHLCLLQGPTLAWPCFLFVAGLLSCDPFQTLLPRERTSGCSLQSPKGGAPRGLLLRPPAAAMIS